MKIKINYRWKGQMEKTLGVMDGFGSHCTQNDIGSFANRD